MAGTPAQMWTSLSKIASLPPETDLYCAHEYTKANAEFSLSIEPDNTALKQRADTIFQKRKEGKPTIPMRLAEELETSPFLRAKDERLMLALGMAGADPVDVFAEIRRRKDAF